MQKGTSTSKLAYRYMNHIQYAGNGSSIRSVNLAPN